MLELVLENKFFFFFWAFFLFNLGIFIVVMTQNTIRGTKWLLSKWSKNE